VPDSDRSTRAPQSAHAAPARPVLVICGGGNAGHAIAVAASKEFEGDIDWLVGSEQKAEILRSGAAKDGVHATGVITGRADRLRTISSDPAELIPGADIVMVVVPAFMHATVLARIEAHICDGVMIGILPTRGGVEFEATNLLRGGRRGTFFGLQTLPFSARVGTFGESVHVGAVKSTVVFAALPAGDAPTVANRLSNVFGTHFAAADGFLSLTLGNPGQFIHPGLMYGHYRSWRGEEYDQDTIPMFYAGATDEMGEFVATLSREAIEVARAIEAESPGLVDLDSVAPVHDWLRSSYANVTDDTSTVATCFRTGPIQARKAPVREIAPGRFLPEFNYRYLTEDVPYGLVITRGFAELAGVATPAIDEVIEWAQERMGRSYLVDGRLEGQDISDVPVPQNYGITRVSQLVKCYEEMSIPSLQLLR
jgi:hypothetical protein